MVELPGCLGDELECGIVPPNGVCCCMVVRGEECWESEAPGLITIGFNDNFLPVGN